MYSRIKNIIKRNLPVLSWFGGIVLIGASFVLPGSGAILLLAIPMMLYYVENLRKHSLRQALLYFYTAGITLTGFAFLFMFQTALDNWNTVITGWFAFGSIFISWVILCTLCALPMLFFSWFCYRIKNNTYRLIAFVCMWPIVEIARSLSFSIVTLGPGTDIHTNFNFGALGGPLSGTPMVFLSRIAGFWGMGLGAMLIGLGIYVIRKRQYLVGSLLITLIVVCTVIGYLLPVRQSDRYIKTTVVHLNEKDTLTQWDSFDGLPNGIDLLVLPEYSEATAQTVINKVSEKLSENGVAITSVMRIDEHGRKRNTLTYFNKGGIISEQDKTLLVPNGEYLPYVAEAAFKLFKQDRLITTFKYTQQIAPGTTAEEPVSVGGITFGALACSGATVINEYKSMMENGADIFVNSASLSFLRSNSIYHVHGDNMARFQAVSNSRPLIQASRSGNSFMYDSQGKIMSKSTGQQTQVITKDMKL